IYRILAGQVRERLTGFQALLNGGEGVAGVGSSFYQNVGGPTLFPGKLFSTRLILLAYFFFRNLNARSQRTLRQCDVRCVYLLRFLELRLVFLVVGFNLGV